MKIKTKLIALFIATLFVSCSNDKSDSVNNMFNFDGVYTQKELSRYDGFPEEKEEILEQIGMDTRAFNDLSIKSASILTEDQRISLKTIRENVSRPTVNVVIQKVIPLDDVIVYMNNTYGGTIGGSIYEAGDIKDLKTQKEVIEGLRLDYDDSKFKVDGAGYAVIRFEYNITNSITIPFSLDMGGTSTGVFPFTGTGFTASLLGDGGYPEYIFETYNTPSQGAELYEVTPNGNELLRSQFIDGRWQTYEGVLKSSVKDARTIRNGRYADYNGETFEAYYNTNGALLLVSDNIQDGFIYNHKSDRYSKIAQTSEVSKLYCIESCVLLSGYELSVRGEGRGVYHVSSTDPKAKDALNLTVLEKGLYGKVIPTDEIQNLIYEVIR